MVSRTPQYVRRQTAKWCVALIAAVFFVACGGRSARSGPLLSPSGSRPSETGVASWYGPGFHGKPTASGEPYDQNAMTAAHRTLPLGTRVRVTNLDNNRSVQVRVNDRGPFVDNRIIDVSYAAAQQLNMVGPGTARVRVEVIASPAPMESIRSVVVYTIQLGSFSSRETAEPLRDRVTATFGAAEIVEARVRGVTVYRVQTGSFTDRAKADDERMRARRAGFDAIVVEK